jgi:hypothetical protein
LLPPECQLLVHCINIVIYELDPLTEGRSVLANALDHALDQLELLLVQVSPTNHLLRRLFLLLTPQLTQTYLVLSLLLLLLGLLLSRHLSFSLRLNSLDILRIFLLLRSILLRCTRLLLNYRWRRSNFLLLFFFLGLPFWNSRLLWRIIGFFDASSGGGSIGFELFLLLLLLRFRIGLA